MATTARFVAIMSAIFFLGCNSPFFPATGKPKVETQFRRSPAGVIRQLETAYEHRRIDLFTDLFYPDSFRFYIASSFDPQNSKPRLDSSLLNATGQYPYIHRYYSWRKFEYWGFNSERRSHEALFSKAVRLDFTTGLNISSTTFLLDTIRDSSSGAIVRIDTTRAETVLEDGALLQVEAPQFRGDVTIGVQVFYMIRDPRNPALWVIYKWFDLAR